MAFEAGDVVALRKDYLSATAADVSCVKVIGSGLPNEFTVAAVLDASGTEALKLSPCCGRLRDERGETMCEAHPAYLFDMLRRADPAAAGLDKILSIFGAAADPKSFLSLDLAGFQAVRIGHYEEGDKIGLTLSLFGSKPLVLAGKKTPQIAEWLRKLETL